MNKWLVLVKEGLTLPFFDNCCYLSCQTRIQSPTQNDADVKKTTVIFLLLIGILNYSLLLIIVYFNTLLLLYLGL